MASTRRPLEYYFKEGLYIIEKHLQDHSEKSTLSAYFGMVTTKTKQYQHTNLTVLILYEQEGPC